MATMIGVLAGMTFAAALGSTAHAQRLVTQKNMSLAMAQTIANAAMEKCKEMGYRVSVTVVDRAGMPIVMLRGDGAGLHTPEGSDRKAYTARTFRAPSADFANRMADDPTVAGEKEYTRVLALAGGLPIKVGDDVVGASACRARPERTTTARKQASTRWPTSSSEPMRNAPARGAAAHPS